MNPTPTAFTSAHTFYTDNSQANGQDRQLIKLIYIYIHTERHTAIFRYVYTQTHKGIQPYLFIQTHGRDMHVYYYSFYFERVLVKAHLLLPTFLTP